MPKPGNKIRIPTEDEILAAILQVKPTADMPRPGAQRSEPKKGTKRKAKRTK